MQIGKIIGRLISQTASKTAELSPEIIALQKSNSALLSQNLSMIQNFAEKEMPEITKNQTKLVAEMEKLAQLAKSSIK